MNQAIGLIEVQGLAAAITIADVMVKVAAVRLIGVQRAKGFGWMSVEITGDVAAVQAAVDAGKAKASENGTLISALVIPRPVAGLDKLIVDQADYPKPAVQAAETEKTAPKEDPQTAEPAKPPKKAEEKKTEKEESKADLKAEETKVKEKPKLIEKPKEIKAKEPEKKEDKPVKKPKPDTKKPAKKPKNPKKK